VFVYNLPGMRKFIFILIIFLTAALVYLSFGELESIMRTLRQGNLWFLLLAIIIQSSWFFVSGLTYLSLYRLLGVDGTLYKLSLLSAASNFVSTVAPSAGMSGIVVFFTDASRNGQSQGKITVISVLYIFLDYFAFLFVLTLGLIVLFRRNDLDPSEITASAIIFIIAVALGSLLYLGSRSGEAFGKALAWLARLVNRVVRPFLHRDYLSEERAHEFAHEMATDLKSLPEHPRSLITPISLAFANKALMVCILAVSFMSFNVPFSIETIIGGFAISYLFLIVSPTPSGIGIVEGIMPLALNSLNVEWSQAVVITLAYRGITFWFPLGIGAWAFRHLHLRE
jgi:glycosyltransferase 2 family protein